MPNGTSPKGVALIAAVAAIAGSAVGGIVTYVGNDVILNKQTDREEKQHNIAARGVARVYAEELVSAGKVLRYTLTQGRWPGRNDLSYFVLPALEDRRLVQGRLTATYGEDVSAADQVLHAVASIITIEPRNKLTANARAGVETDVAVVERGARALRSLGA